MKLKSFSSVIPVGTHEVAGSDYPQNSYKFCTKSWLKKQSIADSIWNVIDSVEEEGFKNTLVDIKVHHLCKGIVPAKPMWHFDCVTNPLRSDKEEIHHIILFGANCCTQFLKEEIALDIEPDKHYNWDDFVHHDNYVSIERGILYKYGRHLHRAAPSEETGTRLLIRITQSDIITPFNRVFTPTYT